MSQIKFKKSAIALAVLGAFASGVAQAAAPELATAPYALAIGTSYTAFVTDGDSAAASVRFNVTEDISGLDAGGLGAGGDVAGIVTAGGASALLDGAADGDSVVTVGNITSVSAGVATIGLTIAQGNITTVGTAVFKWNGTQLTIVDDGDDTFTPLVVTLKIAAGALSDGIDTTPDDDTADNPSLELTLSSFKQANVPTAPNTAKTLDADADGDLDGVTIDFVEDVTVSAGVGGVVISSTDGDNALTAGSVTASGSTVTAAATMATALNTGDHTTYAVDYTAGGEKLIFTNVYDPTAPATGAAFAKLDVATIGNIVNVDDNAKPVLLSVSRVQDQTDTGLLNLVFSEAMDNAGSASEVDIATDGSTLELAQLNAGVAAATRGQATKTVADDTVEFSGVDLDVLTAITDAGINASNAGVADNTEGLLPTAGTVAVDAGGVVALVDVSAPAAETSYVVVNADGFIKQVVLTLTENVTESVAADPADFSVQFGGGIPNLTPSSVAVTAGSKVITLTLAGVGIKSELVSGGDVVYTQDVVLYEDSDDEALATSTWFGVSVPNNSENLYIQEIAAKLTTDGSAPVQAGTEVVALLVEQFKEDSIKIKYASATVPYVVNGGKTRTAAVDLDDVHLVDDLLEAREEGEKTIAKVLLVDTETDDYGPEEGIRISMHDTIDDASPNDAETVYNITIDTKKGTFSGDSGIKGSLKMSDVKAGMYETLDTAGFITGDTDDFAGIARLSLGIDHELRSEGLDEAFVMLSVKQPGEDEFTLVTSPVPTFKNHIKFKSQLDSKSGEATSFTVDLSKIEAISVNEYGNGGSEDWQMLGVTGVVDQAKSKDLDIDRLLVTIDKADGSLITMWSVDSLDDNADDIAFGLSGNKISLISEYEGVTSGKLAPLAGGKGLALENVNDNSDEMDIKLYIPVTGEAPKANISAGWSLITFVANMTGTQLEAAGVEMVMDLNGDESKVWTVGADDVVGQDSLSSVTSGSTYFVFFKKAVKNFEYK